MIAYGDAVGYAASERCLTCNTGTDSRRRRRPRPPHRRPSVERDGAWRGPLSPARPWPRCGRSPTTTAVAPTRRRSTRHGATTPARRRVTMKVEKKASSISVAIPPTAGTTTSRTAAANSGNGTSRAAESGVRHAERLERSTRLVGRDGLGHGGDHQQASEDDRGGVAEPREAHVRRPPRGWRRWWRSAARGRGGRRARAGRRPRPRCRAARGPGGTR